MPSPSGVVIDSVLPGSPGEAAGLQAGDRVLSINSVPVRDVIDFLFYKSADDLTIGFMRHDARKSVHLPAAYGQDLGITVQPLKVQTCRNKCIFCFVKQLPKGLRKSLYVKDEDYRLSFLYGNYMTLSNISASDRQRIVDQRLSPLYISVHTTNTELRNRMLGNSACPDIMKDLTFFAARKIRMHLQVVLCPGLNDGREFEKTVSDLYRLYPYAASVAVVPVGLTRSGAARLRPVTADDARDAIGTVETFQRRFRKKHGDPFVFCSDEMYIKGGVPFPGLREYAGLPQVENGVGMVPLFLSQARKVRVPQPFHTGRRFLTVTGMSFYPYLMKFTTRLLQKEGIRVDVLPIENDFFGTTVTVTGLIVGQDVIKALRSVTTPYDALLLPGAALKDDDDIFLDDVSIREIEEASGIRTVRTDGTPQGLIETIHALEG